MKKLLLSLILSVSSAFAGDFAGQAGLQLYSLRDSFKADVAASLDKVKGFGLKEVELASTYAIEPPKFLAMLQERGLVPVSAHYSYNALDKDVAAIVAEAKALGLKYAACPYIPHPETGFDEAVCRKAIADFNKWGEAFAKEGIVFAYHPHGFEFLPFGDEKMLDLLMKETKPEAVSFEMDVFWFFQTGQDPVQWLEKYPTRWVMMHLKDLRKGAVVGLPHKQRAKTDQVALGDGMVDWPLVLRTAAKVGVKHYFIEDESPAVEAQLPVSLRYLKTLQ
ncbi:MAG: sugar phosphate isomerase/epimerase [Verrucomicrobiota bacterium]